MYCGGTADILDAHGCGVDTHVFIYTHTPSAADSLRPRDGTQCLSLCLAEVTDLVTLRYNKITEWVLSEVDYTWAGISSGF